ncbi:MAG: hypothetical protein CW691_05645 [Candidatus Bathyarchaeum sp.]|nr:MAG: hypothetical protein CW691_05645 [Candidatus Bathyarchaeum sp.]
MLKIKISENSGVVITLIGVALLFVTFVVAYTYMNTNVTVSPISSLALYFGHALSPLIEALIRLLYLGLLGWIASKITTKGITILFNTRKSNHSFQNR